MRAQAIAAEGSKLLVVAVVVPALLMTFAYYGFTTNYTRWVFGEQSFRGQYERGIYRFRLLGREGVLATYHALRDHGMTPPDDKPAVFAADLVHHYDQQGDPTFYAAYFVWNTLGAVLAALALALMLRDRTLFDLPEAERIAWVLASSGAVALTQFVVTPYDTLAYALFIGCAWASLRALRTRAPLAAVLAVALLVLGALNRETAMLNVSLVGAVALAWYGLKRRTFAAAALAAGAFLAVYVALRLALGTERGVFDDFSALNWWRGPFNRAGSLALACVLAVPLWLERAARRRYALFLLGAAPYLVVTLGAGVAWEVRLWVPLVLGGLLVARLREAGSLSPLGRG